jgi:hypothetical protein
MQLVESIKATWQGIDPHREGGCDHLKFFSAKVEAPQKDFPCNQFWYTPVAGFVLNLKRGNAVPTLYLDLICGKTRSHSDSL